MFERHPLAVGGLTRFSTVDYPGYIAAVVFCQGCPWHCSYCHNPHLLRSGRSGSLPWQEVVSWLDCRHGLVEAVVFSGGEPLLQRGLAGAMDCVRKMGYRVALHTAGIYPDHLADLLPLIDWVGFDVKAPFNDYQRITGARSGNAARRALSILLASGKPYEIRCTVDETQLAPEDALCMGRQLSQMGIGRVVLQPRRNGEGKSLPISREFIDAMTSQMSHIEHRLA